MIPDSTVPGRVGNSTGSLHVLGIEGLGNRLHGLLAGVIIGEFFKVKTTLFWRVDQTVPVKFEDLFEPFQYAVTSCERSELPPDDWIISNQVTVDLLTKTWAQGGTVRVKTYDIFCEEIMPREAYDRRMSELLGQLKPVAEVRALIDSIPDAKVGIHVRMTDHLPCRLMTPAWSYRSALNAVRRNCPSASVYICTDTPEFLDELKKESSVQIVSLPASDRTVDERFTAEGTRRGLAELWKLSSCKVIVASQATSFSRTASLKGQVRTHLINVLPKVLRRRQQLILWSLSRMIEFDRNRQCWRRKKLKFFAVNWRGVIAVWLARAACSRWYQQVGANWQHRRVDRRLDDFFRASDLS